MAYLHQPFNKRIPITTPDALRHHLDAGQPSAAEQIVKPGASHAGDSIVRCEHGWQGAAAAKRFNPRDCALRSLLCGLRKRRHCSSFRCEKR
ncbi:MAG: hypothetical protein NZ701_13345, partial [Roseiflexus sp.]|nr:hypothetical protein [Roseiflexus sp.]